jgi:sugar phosphate isomerase/epimerase
MKQDFSHIITRCFVNIPFAEFDSYKPMIAEMHLNPEIGLDGGSLYSFNLRDFRDAATFLADNNLRCTLHAPFQDMLPGAGDHHVLQATRDKLKRCFELIDVFTPQSHSYEPKKWLETSLETWRELLAMAGRHDTPVMFENTYEKGPRIHKLLLESLDSPHARFCLDVGHLLAFANVAWPEWLGALGPWLGQLHLHDNHGFRDEHLPVGMGDFDFKTFFVHLKSLNLDPIITLEPRSESDLWDSLNALDRLAIFDHI